MRTGPYWMRRFSGGEQTQPEYDETKDVPPAPEPEVPRPAEQTHPYQTPTPSQPTQTQPATPPPATPTPPGGEQRQPTQSTPAATPTPPGGEQKQYTPWPEPTQASRKPWWEFGPAPLIVPSGNTEIVTPEDTRAYGTEPIAAESEIVRQLLAPFADGAYRVTGRYGQTGGPYPGTGHIGLDIVPTGSDTSIYAPLRGEVIENAFSEGYGNYLKIRHPDGTVTLYAHMASRSPLAVGSAVADRQLLGQMGATGKATATHLHFEVYSPDGKRYDPLLWLGGQAPADYSAGPQPSSEAPQPSGPAPTAPPTGGRWTEQDAINSIWYWGKKYGYSDSFIHFALAVAYGESGMDPYNDRGDGGRSKGIFQFLTRGGRGEGYSDEQLFNPYFESEINLPILYAAYVKYGGDAGWASDPYSVLKNGWKYGQGSIWPTDSQLRDALAYTGKSSTQNRLPGPEPVPPATEPTSPFIFAPQAPSSFRWPRQPLAAPDYNPWRALLRPSSGLPAYNPWLKWLQQTGSIGSEPEEPSFGLTSPLTGLKTS